MNRIKFVKIQNKGFFEYHLKSDRNDFFEANLFPLSSKLDKKTIEEWSIYLWNQGITYLASEENSLIYTLLIDFFRKDYMTPNVIFSVSDLQAINEIGDTCKWRYCIEYTEEDKELCRDFSFLTPLEFLNKVNYSNKKTNNLYTIAPLSKKFTEQFIKTYSCDVSNWSFIYSKHVSKLKSLLKDSSKRPSKNEFFKVANLMINLQIGEDEGYLDYVLIISPQEIDAKIKEVEERMNLFIMKYENLLKKLEEIDSIEKVKKFNAAFSILKIDLIKK